MVEIGQFGHGGRANQDSLVAVLMTSRLVSDGVKPLSAPEYWKHPELAQHPRLLLEQPPDAHCQDGGFGGEVSSRIASLLLRATAMSFELDRLRQKGIRLHTLTPFDEHYPCQFRSRLKKKTPVVLHAAGPRELLQRPGLGVVGSRDIGEEGADVAKSAARLASRLGIPVISGGGRGVDRLAMNAALDDHGAEGTVVGFLADSLERQLKQPDTRRAILDERVLLCTPYEPDAHFTTGRAMGRNKLIYAGALATLVVASDKKSGGTWAGAVEALKHGFGPVAVWRGPGEGPGNQALEQSGATPVDSLDDLEALLINAQANPISTENRVRLEEDSQVPLPLELDAESKTRPEVSTVSSG